jgi:hypothetical protein
MFSERIIQLGSQLLSSPQVLSTFEPVSSLVSQQNTPYYLRIYTCDLYVSY